MPEQEWKVINPLDPSNCRRCSGRESGAMEFKSKRRGSRGWSTMFEQRFVSQRNVLLVAYLHRSSRGFACGTYD